MNQIYFELTDDKSVLIKKANLPSSVIDSFERLLQKKTDETGLKISLSEFLTFRKSLSRIIISNKLKPEMSDGFKSFLDSNQSYASVVKKEKPCNRIEKNKSENFSTSHQLENISFLCRQMQEQISVPEIFLI